MKHGILSDAHGHVEAFHIALDILRRHGAERLHFLGDAINYIPGTAVVDSLMAQSDVQVIAGNHEVMLLGAGVSAERDSVYQMRRTAAEMSTAHLEFLRALPKRSEISAACGNILFVHGSPVDETFGYVYPLDDLNRLCVPAGTTVFMGHTHRPFVRKEGGVMFVNVGSCGMPRDCGHLGAACLFDDCSGKAEILRFDIRAATEAALKRSHPVHPSVKELFERAPSGSVVGTLVDG